MVRTQVTVAAIALLALTWLTTPVAAHGGAAGPHNHLLSIVVFFAAVLLLGVSLAADHFDLVERSTADVGVVAGGVGIVLSVGLLWI